MNAAEPRKRASGDPVSGAEMPTENAELLIALNLTPGISRPADPCFPVAAIPRRRFTEFPSSWSNRSARKQDAVSLAMRRIQAAIQAETAAVPDRSAEAIEEELALIMSSRPGPKAPGPRRWSRAVQEDQELTAAAYLQIRLVHS